VRYWERKEAELKNGYVLGLALLIPPFSRLAKREGATKSYQLEAEDLDSIGYP